MTPSTRGRTLEQRPEVFDPVCVDDSRDVLTPVGDGLVGEPVGQVPVGQVLIGKDVRTGFYPSVHIRSEGPCEYGCLDGAALPLTGTLHTRLGDGNPPVDFPRPDVLVHVPGQAAH
jgi:hypothetical protein